jgi:short-subunit dehydrogenase
MIAIDTTSSETGGRIDVLVNNASYGLNGDFENLSIDEIKAQYETNVFGYTTKSVGLKASATTVAKRSKSLKTASVSYICFIKALGPKRLSSI